MMLTIAHIAVPLFIRMGAEGAQLLAVGCVTRYAPFGLKLGKPCKTDTIASHMAQATLSTGFRFHLVLNIKVLK